MVVWSREDEMRWRAQVGEETQVWFLLVYWGPKLTPENNSHRNTKILLFNLLSYSTMKIYLDKLDKGHMYG